MIDTTAEIKTREDKHTTEAHVQIHKDTDFNRASEEVTKKIRLIEKSFSTLKKIVP